MKKIIISLCFVLLPLSASAYGNHHRHRSPVVTPLPTPQSIGNEKVFTAYITSYASGDNDPAGSTGTYLNGVEGKAGGDGSYNNPVTIAVGYVGSVADYPLNTKFYIADLHKYFIAQDTCAACHKGNGGKIWLDVYAGDFKGSGVTSYEESITGNYTVIQNPASDYPVILGSLYGG